jgi:hypothetical protein
MGERKAHWRVGGVGGVGELEELAKGIVRWTFFGEIGIGESGSSLEREEVLAVLGEVGAWWPGSGGK